MTAGEAVARLPGMQVTRLALGGAMRRAEGEIGGAVRGRVIGLFACVVALNAADQGTIGAIAAPLERSLHITNGQVGIIAAVAALAGALATVPVGALTDRVHRLHLLAVSIALWSVAMLGGAFAPSFLVLVLTRLALGAVTATAGPTLASLTGDFFPARERARIWGLILSGQLLGSGVGVVVGGNLAGMLSWRWAFGCLAVPGIVLAVGVWKLLVEPARGGQSRLEPGAQELVCAKQVRRQPEPPASYGRVPEQPGPEGDQELAQEMVRDCDTDPVAAMVLREDPVDMPLWQAVRYVLRVRTNLVLIVAAALGYLFFAGVQTFAVVLLRSRYHLGQSAASSLLILVGAGAVFGVIFGGRIADRLLRRGWIAARVGVSAVCYFGAAIVFIPALLIPVAAVSLPLFVLGGALLAAPDPPMNAARLDIMHPRLWGRAEGVRTVLQMGAYACAPLTFGFVSEALGGPRHGCHLGDGNALSYTFLIMLLPLAIGGVSLLRARHAYPCDVATVIASTEAITAGDAARTDS